MHVDIRAVINSAWLVTVTNLENADLSRTDRSRVWVNSLASAFSDVYSVDPENQQYRVFWGQMTERDRDFHRKEFLHDILICKTSVVRSIGSRGQSIPFVSEVLWQVESELRVDTRQISIDFSKLVMGSAEKKLFVAMRSKREDITEKLIDVCHEMGQFVFGDVYLCVLDDFDDWSINSENPLVSEISAESNP